jgi:hypothetical protein
MSNSMYSNIDTEDVFASAMEEAEIVENPFVQGAGDGEPLHAVDAARRLLGGDDEEHLVETGFTNQEAPTSTSGAMGNSLYERIQQQKKQQNTVAQTNTSQMTTSTTSEGQFGYPIVEEGAYSMPGTSNDNIPQYSQVPAPSAYNTETPYASSINNNQESIDYKGHFMNALSVVGSAAGTVAKTAYQGTKTVYGKVTNKKPNTGMQNAGGMAEMDYQRESLLMDPHDLEDRAASMATGSHAHEPPMSASPSGMRAGIISANASGNEHSFVTFLKQFAVDMKDLFLGASRRVQIGIVALVVLIIWLIFFE